MARHGVKKEDVFLACGQLLEKGTAITVANVRAELGTGSYGTLLPFIREFNSQDAGAGSVPDLTEVLAAKGASLAQELWADAVSEANRRVAELEKKFATEIEAFKTELSVKAHELETVRKESVELRGQLSVAEAAFENSKSLAQRAEAELSVIREKVNEHEEASRRSVERAAVAEHALATKVEDSKQLHLDLKESRLKADEMRERLHEAQKLSSQKDGELMTLKVQAKANADESRRNLERAVVAEKELALIHRHSPNPKNSVVSRKGRSTTVSRTATR